jgi:hypothetical protein
MQIFPAVPERLTELLLNLNVRTPPPPFEIWQAYTENERRFKIMSENYCEAVDYSGGQYEQKQMSTLHNCQFTISVSRRWRCRCRSSKL